MSNPKTPPPPPPAPPPLQKSDPAFGERILGDVVTFFTPPPPPPAPPKSGK